MVKEQRTLDAIFEVLSFLNTGPLKRPIFDNLLSDNGLSFQIIQKTFSVNLVEFKEDEVFLTEPGKEWFYHLGYLLKKRTFKTLMEFYHHGTEPHLVHDAVSFIINYMEKLPSIDSFWICSPWISIHQQNRIRFKKCLGKIKHVQVITRPPEKNSNGNIRYAVEDSLNWLYDQGIDKISLHDNVHAKVYLIEQSANTWRNRVLIIGSENFTFSDNPELSLCIYDDRLFRDARARLASLITGKRFTRSIR